MQFSQYAYIALELARERMLEAEAYHRHAEALRAPTGPGLARRSLARAAAGVSRAAAFVARRLDSAVDTDFGGRSTVA